MKQTYYDILGLLPDADLADITKAKNKLAKLYHPDNHIQHGFDTTEQMAEILEAYDTLSNPEKRTFYDEKVLGIVKRNFQTFTMEEEIDESKDFLQYWKASDTLEKNVKVSCEIIRQIRQHSGKRIPMFHRIIHRGDIQKEMREQLTMLAQETSTLVALLTASGIPADLWNPDAMNWVLVRWSQKQESDYTVLFHRYRVQRDEQEVSTDKTKRRLRNRRFHHRLNRLLSFASCQEIG